MTTNSVTIARKQIDWVCRAIDHDPLLGNLSWGDRIERDLIHIDHTGPLDQVPRIFTKPKKGDSQKWERRDFKRDYGEDGNFNVDPSFWKIEDERGRITTAHELLREGLQDALKNIDDKDAKPFKPLSALDLLSENLSDFEDIEKDIIVFLKSPKGIKELSNIFMPRNSSGTIEDIGKALGGLLGHSPEDTLESLQSLIDRKFISLGSDGIGQSLSRSRFGVDIRDLTLSPQFSAMLGIQSTDFAGVLEQHFGPRAKSKLNGDVTLDDFEGPDKDNIHDFIGALDTYARAPKGLGQATGIVGPRGTGKTTIAGLAEEEADILFFMMKFQSSELSPQGHKPLGQKTETVTPEIMLAKLEFDIQFASTLGLPIALCIDDAEQFFGNLKSQINEIIQDSPVPLVFIFNDISRMDKAFLSRLSPMVFMMFTNEERREQTLKKWVSHFELDIPDNEMKDLLDRCHTLSHREIKKSCEFVAGALSATQRKDKDADPLTPEIQAQKLKMAFFNTRKAMSGGFDPLPPEPEITEMPYNPELHASITDLDVFRDSLKAAQDLRNERYHLALVTGPTDSGRTTFAKKTLEDMGWHERDPLIVDGNSFFDGHGNFHDGVSSLLFEQSRREEKPLIIQNAEALSYLIFNPRHPLTMRMSDHEFPIWMTATEMSPMAHLEADAVAEFEGIDTDGFRRMLAFWQITGHQPDPRIHLLEDLTLTNYNQAYIKASEKGKQGDPKFWFEVLHASAGNPLRDVNEAVIRKMLEQQRVSIPRLVQTYPNALQDAPFAQAYLPANSDQQRAAASIITALPDAASQNHAAAARRKFTGTDLKP